MAISGVDSTAYTQSTASTAKSSGSNSLLSMDDFLSLMIAQLANQDMYNPVDNSEYIAQMAQFSMIQALTELTQASTTSYGVSLIGKEATVAQVDSNGYLQQTKGIVEGVNLFNGETEIIIDGVAYKLSSVMQIAEPKIIVPNQPTDPDETEGNNNTGGSEDDGTVDGTDGATETGTDSGDTETPTGGDDGND